jgi:hypothetical protein
MSFISPDVIGKKAHKSISRILYKKPQWSSFMISIVAYLIYLDASIIN